MEFFFNLCLKIGEAIGYGPIAIIFVMVIVISIFARVGKS